MIQDHGERKDDHRMSASGTQSIDRAAELLSLVVEAADAPQFGALVSETGLAKSTASRLLQALERHHLVQRDDQGGYQPGALFAAYTARHDPVDQLVTLARPSLDAINKRTGETVNLAVPRGSAVVQVVQVDAKFVLGVTNWVGVDVPAHCSALGKICYAYGGLEVPDRPLGRRTARTIVAPAALRRELTAIRRRGYATTESELESGLDAVAAPVLGSDGDLVAAIGASGPSQRIASQRGELAALLMKEGMTLSRRLGYRPTVPVNGKEGVA